MDNNQCMVYKVKEIQNILQISKTSTYDLIKKKKFPVLHFGGSYRIPKKQFHKWLEINKESDV